MAELKGKNILVMGASGVLGGLIATELASHGAIVMATSSTLESAERVPHAGNPRLLLDLNNPESVEVLTEYLVSSEVPIDGIVNATGLVAFGPIGELEAETLVKLFSVNALGPIQLFSGLMPLLKVSAAKGNDPFIMTISGVVAESPMAGLAAYSASKTALYGFSQAAQRELRREGIRIIDAWPGHTETGLASRAISGTAPNFPQGFEPITVAQRLVKAIIEDEKDLPSSSF